MVDDLVDRLVRQREAEKEARDLEVQIALRRTKTVEENSDPLWRALIAEVRRLVGKYNHAFRDRIVVDPAEPEHAGHFEVRRDTFPIVVLSLSRPKQACFKFSIRRIERSFSEIAESHGRIDIQADVNCNLLFLFSDGAKFATVPSVAEYLLEPVLKIGGPLKGKT